MVKMMRFLKPYKALAILAPIFMLLEVMMDLMQPMYMQRIVDVGIANGDTAYVYRSLLMMLGVALIGYVGGFGCSYFSAIAAVNAGTDLRGELYTHVQNLSYGNIDRLKTGNLITRLTNDVVQVQRVMMMMMRIMVRAPLQIIGSFIMTYIISPKLFLILLIIVPLLVLVMAIVLVRGYKLFRIVQERLDHVNTVMQENLAGIRVVKAFVREKFEIMRFGKVNEAFTDVTVNVSRKMAIMTPITMIFINLGVIAVLWFGNIQVNTGTLQVGKVMAFINYLLQLLNSLTMAANLLMMYSRAQASAERIYEVLDTKADIEDKEGQPKVEELSGNLVFDHVSFSYTDHNIEPVLTDISFVARPGEKVAIIGSTGSGKSTLVNLIPRLYEVSAGSIAIGGKDIRDFTQKSLRKHMGIVLQQSLLFSGTIAENIKDGKSDATDEEVRAAAASAGASEFIDDYLIGYNTKLGQKGVNLSGGQKQRLSIARALIRNPHILILDDSTSAVDVVTEAKIQRALKKRCKEGIVIMVAQRISSVLDADQILVLEDGRLVGKGNHQSLILTNTVYRDIYESQLGKAGELIG